jgi:hypothetical protein
VLLALCARGAVGARSLLQEEFTVCPISASSSELDFAPVAAACSTHAISLFLGWAPPTVAVACWSHRGAQSNAA